MPVREIELEPAVAVLKVLCEVVYTGLIVSDCVVVGEEDFVVDPRIELEVCLPCFGDCSELVAF